MQPAVAGVRTRRGHRRPGASGGQAGRPLGIPATELHGYGQREQTRTEQLREILAYTGWQAIDVPGWKELDEFLFARAMEHDSPKLLFRLACEYLASGRVVRPGVVSLLERVASARERARAETWALLAHLVKDDLGGCQVHPPKIQRI